MQRFPIASWNPGPGGYPAAAYQHPPRPPPPWAGLISATQPLPPGVALAGFERTLVYMQRAPVEVITRDLTEIARTDLKSEAIIHKYGTRMLWCVLVFIVCFALGCFVYVPFVGCLVAAWIFYRSSVHKGAAKRFDIENRRYILIGRLLGSLREDMLPGAPVSVYASFESPIHEGKCVGTAPYGRLTLRRYVDPWLWVRAELRDGTRVTLSAQQNTSVKAGWKTGSSGKTKYKTKSKGRIILSVDVAAASKKLGGFDRIASTAHQAMQLPPQLQVRDFYAKDGQVAIKAALGGDWEEPPDVRNQLPQSRLSVMFASMLMSAYQPILLARAVKKRGAGT